MNLRPMVALCLLAGLCACSSESPNTAAEPASANPGSAYAAPAPVVAATSGAELQGIVLRVAPGGRPDAFCIPEWSFANQTADDVPGLLIQIGWTRSNGDVLEAVSEFGTLQSNLSSGQRVDRTLNGHAAPCNEIVVTVGTYACRDDNAVRVPCPGPVHVLTEGGIKADVSALQEGGMRGAVEP